MALHKNYALLHERPGWRVKSVSLDRFTTRLGAISPSLLEEVAAAIALCVGYQGV